MRACRRRQQRLVGILGFRFVRDVIVIILPCPDVGANVLPGASAPALRAALAGRLSRSARLPGASAPALRAALAGRLSRSARLPYPVQFSGVLHNVIVIIALPQMTKPPVGIFSGERFPAPSARQGFERPDDTMHMVRHDRECIEPNPWKPLRQIIPFLPDDHPKCRQTYPILRDITQKGLPTACAHGHKIIPGVGIIMVLLPNGSPFLPFDPNVANEDLARLRDNILNLSC